MISCRITNGSGQVNATSILLPGPRGERARSVAWRDLLWSSSLSRPFCLSSARVARPNSQSAHPKGAPGVVSPHRDVRHLRHPCRSSRFVVGRPSSREALANRRSRCFGGCSGKRGCDRRRDRRCCLGISTGRSGLVVRRSQPGPVDRGGGLGGGTRNPSCAIGVWSELLARAGRGTAWSEDVLDCIVGLHLVDAW